MSWSKTNFVKRWIFYLDKRPTQGNGDLLYNTFRMIIATEDKSEWAYRAFEACFDCLAHGERWPDSMSVFVTTTNHRQDQLTRDPFILGYACAVYLDRKQFIESVPIPWYLYRPEVWAWRRALLGKRNCYPFWRWLTPHKRHEYVKALDRYMNWAYETLTTPPGDKNQTNGTNRI